MRRSAMSPCRAPVARRTAPACASRHRAFVARLRCGMRAEARVVAPMCVFRRQAVQMLARLIAPLRLALFVDARRSTSLATWVRATTRGQAAPIASQRAPRAGLLRSLVDRTTTLLLRVSQEQRTERLPRAGTTQIDASTTRHHHSVRIERTTTYPQVVQTVVRSAIATAASAAAAAVARGPSDAVHAPRREPVAARTAAPQLALPPHELSRLTDHVLQQIDHRVRSFGERMGRG